jgi:hypothetical protein
MRLKASCCLQVGSRWISGPAHCLVECPSELRQDSESGGPQVTGRAAVHIRQRRGAWRERRLGAEEAWSRKEKSLCRCNDQETKTRRRPRRIRTGETFQRMPPTVGELIRPRKERSNGPARGHPQAQGGLPSNLAIARFLDDGRELWASHRILSVSNTFGKTDCGVLTRPCTFN